MASASVAGTLCEVRSTTSELSRSGTDLDAENCDLHVTSLYKKRRISSISDFLPHDLRRMEESLPSLHSPDYYMEPCLEDMVRMELLDPSYCSRVPDFVVGRFGYGYVKFFGKTDVRGLDLDQIVKFRRHEVIVYEDESNKPMVGQGLNKTAEVTLRLQIDNLDLEKHQVDGIVKKLRQSMRSQGAQFIAFDPTNGEWKFLVYHFSRFGLSEDDEEDIIMDDATGVVQDPGVMDDGGNPEIDEDMQLDSNGPLLSHSLPSHLGLDPAKMKEMRMLMFPAEEEEELADLRGTGSNQKQAFAKEYIRASLNNSNQRMTNRSSPPVVRKTPVALLEYNSGTFDSSSSRTVLMTQENKGLPLKTTKREGFKLDIKQETPVTGSHSHNIVDAALFMGRSFRVGWGPGGILVHSGAPVGSNNAHRVLSSVINVEKVAIDKVVRDENSKVKKELVDFAFDAPLNLHKALNYEEKSVEVGSFQLKLLKVVSNRLELSDICRSYIDIIERQLDVPGLSSSARLVLMHQVMVWELIKVLFSERENTGQLKSMAADEEDMMQDIKEDPPEVDLEALPLIRRAHFSCWLQESVCHRVQEEVSSVNDSGYLEHLFFLLTGRQLDAAVELAASKGDVRLACLLSQAGGSTVNRSDVARQLDIWRRNGMDFNFIEKERIRLYELLAGNIHGALRGINIDWKRFLGLLMWYHLPSDTALPVVFQTYQHLLDVGKAPFPVPIYIDEGSVEENANLSRVERFDLSYYLMLLHASEEGQLCSLKTMFSTFSSTHDPLDYHMIWHQRAILEAVGAFNSNDLQALDMGLISQLVCQEQCHWAIYVALHMPYRDDYPYLQAILIREILFQYCESWSSQESQRQFIEDLGIPLQWLHEALAVYYNYHGDLPRALEHFLECENWQKAHSIFMTTVAHALFLSANESEVWRIATFMENHKSEIENWDLGAGIYISFYVLRSSFQEDNNVVAELDSLDSKNAACRDFLGRLNESLAVWAGRLHVDTRVAYSKMAEEICNLLLSDTSGSQTHDDQLSCYDTVFSAPIPEDLRSTHLQDAVAVFTCSLSEVLS
ncbi:PRECOCIOUS, SUPPRESSOR OF AUXIN RESISTANCE 3, MODIFIER OF SNC1,3 [Hibiscus trionum]|uniref:PRECOCIOUS, SUPPRESSOR OF AUXIN RESISTANCE 3, MODIFIER OF SNC1,3 n=1 Tax=Hibiscus trionum TaxID=183268 RepID=A0A9W7HJ62_HIBTR|nr:PRECOCIOUS, SUPPRESSOR OF AUXIN RESISTANCE 3, MODIFIER OF SNC1,3 [Hibiscus trionum]